MTTTAPPKYDESFNNDAMIDDNDDEVADNRDDGDTVTFAAVQEPLTARTKRPRSFCRHCFVMCGGITVTVFSCVTLVMIGLGFVGYAIVATGVRRYTVETPIDITNITVPKEEMTETFHEIEHFIKCISNFDEVHNSSGATDLIISSRFMNGIISHRDYLRRYAHVIMKENELLFQTSVPLSHFIPGGKNRYFVSTTNITSNTRREWWTNKTTITVSFEVGKRFPDEYDGPIFVIRLLSYFRTAFFPSIFRRNQYDWVLNVLSMEQFGKPLGTRESWSEKGNILQSSYDESIVFSGSNITDDKFFIAMRNIESIRIEADQLVIRPRNILHHRRNTNTSESNHIPMLQQIRKLIGQ